MEYNSDDKNNLREWIQERIPHSKDDVSIDIEGDEIILSIDDHEVNHSLIQEFATYINKKFIKTDSSHRGCPDGSAYSITHFYFK